MVEGYGVKPSKRLISIRGGPASKSGAVLVEAIATLFNVKERRKADNKVPVSTALSMQLIGSARKSTLPVISVDDFESLPACAGGALKAAL